MIASLGRLATVWLNGWGVLLVGMMLGGIALPLLLESWSGARSSRGLAASALVLVGGLMLRAVIVFSSDGLP